MGGGEQTLSEGAALDDRSEMLAAWESRARRILAWPMTALVVLFCVILLLGWVPHYLIWPWWPDLDDFANQALSWAKGVLPYRDIKGGSFPGQTYMFYVLGKLFGWGKTWPIHALDAGCVVTLGVVLMAWSRRLSGWALPGAIGFLMFLSYYLGLNYFLVAQRDWHASFLVGLALLIPQAWPGRGGRFLSAFLAAFAATFRPHVVVFGPALLLAIDEGGRRPGEPVRKGIRAIVEWLIAFAVFLVLVYLPLIYSGILDDFLRQTLDLIFSKHVQNENLGVVWFSPGMSFLYHFGRAPIQAIYLPCGVILLALTSYPREQRLAFTWIVAFLGALLYAPLHPIAHAYLEHALAMILAINGAVLVLLILRSPFFSSSATRLITLLLVVPSMITARSGDRYFSPVASLQAVRFLAAGEMPEAAPPGYVNDPYRSVVIAAYYPWEDYRAAIEFIRTNTDPETRVANVLKGCAAINGPTARLSVFSTETGILSAWGLGAQWEVALTRELERTPNSIVVWDPEKPFVYPKLHRLDTMTPVIKRLYEPHARFGSIEIWRRR
jgi:hypothetical protein